MHYDSVLAYVKKVLENRRISCMIYEEPFENVELLDHGLRESLYKGFDKDLFFKNSISTYEDRTLYYYCDEHYCNYICIKLPNPEKKQYFLIGPFTYIDINASNYEKILKSLDIPVHLLPLLENYYYNIPFVNSETQFVSFINTLAESIWEGTDYQVSVSHGKTWWLSPNDEFLSNPPDSLYLTPINVNVVESRYYCENQLMQAVSHGNLALADQLLAAKDGIRYVPKTSDELRDYKNYLITLDTLLRKAAEHGGVHPVYLEQVSSRFIKQIEGFSSIPENCMERDMIHKYCRLVLNYSVKGCSPVVQKVIHHVNLNLTDDLSLKHMADLFHISAGYLSTLFKKETGSTLTDYVNKKRIEHAILLLNTTNLQIQTIAAYCGIQDINYFTRIFRKINGMSPSKYREMISQPFQYQ